MYRGCQCIFFHCRLSDYLFSTKPQQASAETFGGQLLYWAFESLYYISISLSRICNPIGKLPLVFVAFCYQISPHTIRFQPWKVRIPELAVTHVSPQNGEQHRQNELLDAFWDLRKDFFESFWALFELLHLRRLGFGDVVFHCCCAF